MKKVVIAIACAAVLFGAGDDAKKAARRLQQRRYNKLL